MFNEILVVGSGTMGLGVASLLAFTASKVTLVVRNPESVSNIEGDLKKLISKLIKRNHPDISIDSVLSKVYITSELAPENRYELIFEAVVENIDIKKSVINKYKHYATENTIWATNTSSLSVTDMAAAFSYPNNFIGLHFFNPVSNMQLVEVIPSMLTSECTIKTCLEFCSLIGKKAVKVEDSPGFIVNRLLIPMINEAVGILESKVATVEEIDAAMKLGANHPLGPLALADLIGNDVCLSIMNALYSSTCDSKYRPSYLLQKMVSANMLGRKSGHGFYCY
ncbi:3-hydroxyacyl-CoA dehydrogenase family protein [Rheinheimera fenheensis]|uniref:3-hydroxyacyl-CoA dehydrogenase family protein n=1 Tax=Rheinheimera fenheensis TaxID=3152295 RepID=UPI003260AC89